MSLNKEIHFSSSSRLLLRRSFKSLNLSPSDGYKAARDQRAVEERYCSGREGAYWRCCQHHAAPPCPPPLLSPPLVPPPPTSTPSPHSHLCRLINSAPLQNHRQCRPASVLARQTSEQIQKSPQNCTTHGTVTSHTTSNCLNSAKQ